MSKLRGQIARVARVGDNAIELTVRVGLETPRPQISKEGQARGRRIPNRAEKQAALEAAAQQRKEVASLRDEKCEIALLRKPAEKPAAKPAAK